MAEEAFINLQKTADYLIGKFAESLKPYEITPTQFNVLRILRNAGEEGLINREIGERMLNFVPDVTRMLDRLEAKNLVYRERGISDRRSVTACITPEGLNLLTKLDQVFQQFQRDFLGSCSVLQLQNLIETLETLRCVMIETHGNFNAETT